MTTYGTILEEVEDLLKKATPEERDAFLRMVGIPAYHEKGSLRYGLAGLKGVGEIAAQHIVDVREQGGPYRSIQDFFRRIDTKIVNKKTLESLIKAGAFDSLHPNRALLMANLEGLMDLSREEHKRHETGEGHLGMLR